MEIPKWIEFERDRYDHGEIVGIDKCHCLSLDSRREPGVSLGVGLTEIDSLDLKTGEIAIAYHITINDMYQCLFRGSLEEAKKEAIVRLGKYVGYAENMVKRYSLLG